MTRPDTEVGVFAVRSFLCRGNPDRLTSIAMPFEGYRVSSDGWLDGTCTAVCGGGHEHAVPDPDCTCGIYGSMTIDSLRRQYGWEAARIVTVIAAEGRTIIGPKGLRTERARVVAYWTPWYARRESVAARKQFHGATGYTILNDMLTAYGIPSTMSSSEWAGQPFVKRIGINYTQEKEVVPA